MVDGPAAALRRLLRVASDAPPLRTDVMASIQRGDVVCFFQCAQKFKSRYATLGFSDKAHLDDGAMWPTSFAVAKLTAPDEARIGALVKRAVSGP